MLAAKGGLLFIDDLVSRWSEWPDFYPRGVEDVTYEGHVLGVPYRFNYRGNPIIRPSMYETAGMEVHVSRTWDEVNEAARTWSQRQPRAPNRPKNEPMRPGLAAGLPDGLATDKGADGE